MSASSSTIRMSCAMGYRAQLGGGIGSTGSSGETSIAGKHQRRPRTARFSIFQHQLPLVIFHDLFDDSEPQAGALRARRHIGLGQPLAIVLRQAFAVVLDGYRDATFRLADRHRDPSGGAGMRAKDENSSTSRPISST